MLALLAVLAAAGNGLLAFAQTTAVDAFDPATGAVRQLALGSEPAWSPDGQKLAYVRGGQVYVANADGSGEVAVGPGSYPSWYPMEARSPSLAPTASAFSRSTCSGSPTAA